MAKHFKGWINPYTNGLLGGIAAGGAAWDKFNLANAQIEGRIKAYQAKYSNMADVQKMREQNNALMGQLKMEANQRTYSVDQTGDDGKPYKVTYRNVMNPDSGHYEPQEVGRVPLMGKAGGAPTVRQFGDDMKQYNPDTGTWDTIGSARRSQDPAVAAREAARDAKIDTREAARDARSKAEKLDSDVSKDMDKFDKADPDTQAKLLKSAGVNATVADTSPHRSLMHPIDGEVDPNATKPNDDARAQYEAAVTAKHAKALGIKPPSDQGGDTSAPPSAGDTKHPAMTVNGQPVRMGASGPYVLDKDGKQVPVTKDAQGNLVASGAPLAMVQTPDTGDQVASNDGSPDEETSPDDEQDQNGLLASNEPEDPATQMDSPESNAEDEQDDAAQDDQQQGLLA